MSYRIEITEITPAYSPKDRERQRVVYAREFKRLDLAETVHAINEATLDYEAKRGLKQDTKFKNIHQS